MAKGDSMAYKKLVNKCASWLESKNNHDSDSCGTIRLYRTYLQVVLAFLFFIAHTTAYGENGVVKEKQYQKTPARYFDMGTHLENPIVIAVLGDSLSAAYGIPIEQGWVHLMQQRLIKKGSNAKVINGSISGATTAAGLQQLPALLAKHRPNIVILELGANDGLQGKPVAYIARNLEQLVLLIQKSGAKVLLVGIRLPPNLGSRYTEPFFEQYAKLAKKHRLSYLPFLLEGVAGNTQFMQADGLHPNALGQNIILDNVWPILTPLID